MLLLFLFMIPCINYMQCMDVVVFCMVVYIANMCYHQLYEGAFSSTLTVVFLINFWDVLRILTITSQRNFVLYFSSILDSCIIKYDNMQIIS